MGRITVKLSDRAHAYAAYGMFEEDGNLMCRHCNCGVKWMKKDNVEKHLKSVQHQRMISTLCPITGLLPAMPIIVKKKIVNGNARVGTVRADKEKKSTLSSIKKKSKDDDYLNTMMEIKQGLQAISTSIQGFAQSQAELLVVETERNKIFRNCLSLFEDISSNINLMPKPVEGRNLNEEVDID